MNLGKTLLSWAVGLFCIQKINDLAHTYEIWNKRNQRITVNKEKLRKVKSSFWKHFTYQIRVDFFTIFKLLLIHLTFLIETNVNKTTRYQNFNFLKKPNFLLTKKEKNLNWQSFPF